MRIYSNYPDSSFRYYFQIDYLSDDEDKVESLELAGDSISFFFDYCDFIVTCDRTDYYFDLDKVVYFRYIDRLNTQLADYL